MSLLSKVKAQRTAKTVARTLSARYEPAVHNVAATVLGENLVAVGGQQYQATGISGNAGDAISVRNVGTAVAAVYAPTVGGGAVLGAGGSSSTTGGDSHPPISLASPSGLQIDALLQSNLALSDSIAGDGLSITSKVLNIGAGLGITINANDVALASSVAGAGLAYDTGVLNIGAGLGITINANDVALASSVAGAGLAYDTGVLNIGAGAGITVNANDVALTTPGTLTASTTNSSSGNHTHAITANVAASTLNVSSTGTIGTSAAIARADHTHAITSSADPGAATSLLKSDATGKLTLPLLVASTSLTTSLVTAGAGQSLTLQSPLDLILDPTSDLVRMGAGASLRASSYASQTTGWRVTDAGEADFRYLFVDEMHAKSFIADLEQALAGGQIIAKSVAMVATDFALPAAGATGTLRVKDLPSAPNMAVFQSGDFVGLRQFSRSAGSLTIGWAWGTVTAYADGTGGNEGTQTWTFTRHATTPGAATGTIPADALALDFGVSGNGFYEVNAIDGAYGQNSPYAQVVTWTTHPATQTVRTRMGNLRGIFSVTDEFGLYAGSGTAVTDRYIRASSAALELRNVPLALFDGTNNTLLLSAGTNNNSPFLAMGSPLPTGPLVNNGIWAGKDGSDYELRVGTISGGVLVKGLHWDGANLVWKATNTSLDESGNLTATNATLSGQITATTGAIGGWTIAANGLTATNIGLYSGAANTARVQVGSGSDIAGINATAAAGDIAFWAGDTHANRAAAEFRVTAAGALTATGATISGAITATSGTITGNFSVTSGGKLTAGDGGVLFDASGQALGLYPNIDGGATPPDTAKAIAWYDTPSTRTGLQARQYVGKASDSTPHWNVTVNPGGSAPLTMTLWYGGATLNDLRFTNLAQVTGLPGLFLAKGTPNTAQIPSGARLQLNSGSEFSATTHLKAAVSNTYDIGEAGVKWRKLYVGEVVADTVSGGTSLGGNTWQRGDAGDMYIYSFSETPSRTLYVANPGTGSMHLDVEGNISLSGTVDGVDIAAFKSAYDSHNHDGRYYTETELQTSGSAAVHWGNVTNPPATYAPSSHALTAHTASGLTVGHVVRASGATTFAWAQLAHSDLSGVGTNSHATIDSHIAATSAHGVSGAIVGTTDTQTLSNKTLTTPTISGTGFTNAQHAHTGASSGGQIAHGSLTGVGANDHHAQSHVLATNAGLGADHTINGAAAGQVLRASSATAAAFAAIQDGDLPSTIVRTSRQVIAGNGLTGGGALSSDVTVTLGTPSSLTATSTNAVTSNSHTHALTTGAALGLSVSTTNAEGSGTAIARADHTHAIATSSNPGAAASILASDDSGYLNLRRLYIRGERDAVSILQLRSTNNDALWSTGDSLGAIEFYSQDASSPGQGVKASIRAIHTGTSTSISQTGLVFSVNTDTEAMRIDHLGGVTIGALSVSRLLATDANDKLVSVSDLSAWIGGTTNRVTVASDGDGTVTLSAPQDIHSAATPTFAGLIAPWLRPASDSTTALQLRNAAGSAVVTVDTTNGRLGVGITPTAKLHVRGIPGSASHLKIDTTTTASADKFIELVSGGNISSGSHWIYATDGLADGSDFIVRGDGAVAIGSLDPGSYKLHVTGTGKFTGAVDTDVQFLGQAADTVSAPSFSWTTDTNTGMWRPSADTIAFSTGGAERVRIASTGAMSVSNPSSGATLNLGRISGQPTIKATEAYLIMDSLSNFAAINHFVNQNVILAYGGGNVGIGTNAPTSYKLDVSGDIRATGDLYVDGGRVDFGTNYFDEVTDFELRGTKALSLFQTIKAASWNITTAGVGTLTDVISPSVRATTGMALTLGAGTDIILSPTSLMVKSAANVSLQSSAYASQTTGWRITDAGEADFRYLFVDEMHAKSFIADLEQALAGGQIIAKSVAMVATDFALPAAGAAGTLRVKDLPSAPNMAVFQSGDFVGLRQFSRSAGSLTIGWAWGTVTAYADGTGGNEGTQTWTFTRSATPGSASGTIPADALVLDFGVSGNGFYEVNATDGAYGQNSPYAQVVTWAVHPATQTVRTRMGNLRGIFSVADEFGLYAGSGTAVTDRYIRASSAALELRNVPLALFDGTNNTLLLSAGTNNNSPFLAMGSPLPTGPLVNNGIWAGKNGNDYELRVGTISGGVLVKGLHWDGANLVWKATNTSLDESGNLTATNATLSGQITATTGAIGGWTIAASGLTATNIGLYSGAANTARVQVGSGSDVAGLNATAAAGDIAFWAGDTHANRAVAEFRVTAAGALTATSGTVGGWTLGASSLTGGSATLSNAGKLTLGTSNDVLIADAADATYRLYIGHATAASAPFWVTKAGSMKATLGTIGGWTLSASSLTSGSAGTTVGLDTGGTNPAIYAGSATPGSAPFRVTNAGVLTATSGTVGGWTLGASSLTGGNAVLSNTGILTLGTSNNVAVMSAADADYRLWVGHASAASAPFAVSKGGVLVSTSGLIGGWAITSNRIQGGPDAKLYATGKMELGTILGMVVIDPNHADWRIWIGSAADIATNPLAGQFRVSDDGYLTASGATIYGHLVANSGDFAGAVTIGTGGGIYQGTGTFASPTTGLKIWNDSGVGRIGGYNAGALQWYAGTDGKLYAGGGAVTLDADGLNITAGSALRFISTSLRGVMEAGNPVESLISNYPGITVKSNGSAVAETVNLLAKASSNRRAEVSADASSNSTISLYAYTGSAATASLLQLSASSFSLAVGSSATTLSVPENGTVQVTGNLLLDELASTPAAPGDGYQARMYVKSDKLVIQYKDGINTRYKYLDLTGTGVTWVHTLTAP